MGVMKFNVGGTWKDAHDTRIKTEQHTEACTDCDLYCSATCNNGCGDKCTNGCSGGCNTMCDGCNGCKGGCKGCYTGCTNDCGSTCRGCFGCNGGAGKNPALEPTGRCTDSNCGACCIGNVDGIGSSNSGTINSVGNQKTSTGNKLVTIDTYNNGLPQVIIGGVSHQTIRASACVNGVSKEIASLVKRGMISKP